MKDAAVKSPPVWPIYCGLALVTFALYLPVIYHDFVQYDDQQYVVENPVVQQGLTGHGLFWAFGFHAGNWHPLAWLSHMLDCQLYGTAASGPHFTSLLLHIATTLLLFAVLSRMTSFFWRSAAVAALFAWHPLHVESVAWIAERKDVLCAFFWMLTLWTYARYAARPAAGRYALVFVSFALCLMAKPMAVTLPFVLLLLDYWPLHRCQLKSLNGSEKNAQVPPFPLRTPRQLLLEKIPLLLLVGIACKLTLAAQQLSIVSTAGLPVAGRLGHVPVAYCHYVIAMFIPRHLAVYYPYEFHPPVAIIAGAALMLAALTALALKNWRVRPYLLIGWLWYLGTLVPVIGFVQVGDQDWADRYTYLPLIGLFIPAVWLAGEIIKDRRLLIGAAAVLGLAMAWGTATQVSYWQNTRTLFSHANQVTDENALAITILGSLLAQEGKIAQATNDYQLALKYEPHFPEAHFFLAYALDQQGDLDAALDEYQKALWFLPTREQTHIFMGLTLARQNRYPEAIVHYQAALKLDPDSAAAENNLARIYHTTGQSDLAIQHYQAAIRIDPQLSLAHNNLGILLVQQGSLADGIRELRTAVKLRPDNAESRYNLALALNQQGDWAEAAGLFTRVQGIYSANARAHYEFGRALDHLKRTREAMGQYAAALLLNSSYADALDALAWILSTSDDPAYRNGPQAVAMAEQACQLTDHNDPQKLKTLGAAYLATSRNADALRTLQSAKDLATKSGQTNLVTDCDHLLAQAQSH